ncbi:hypothetical protein [Saccharolobus islandicus]|uniref:hypothetical protein n=1 Tax=Saccharolobus islandicus TaxID=43080 RepID=UPI00069C468C|nr:hypothetical protein [Sulfolobus islandicus]
MKKLYSVKVRILHKECWTEKIKQYKIRTIKISPYGSKRVKVIIASPSHQIIKDLKESENVNEVSELPRPYGQGISTSRWGFPASQSNLDPPSPTAEVPSNGTVL